MILIALAGVLLIGALAYGMRLRSAHATGVTGQVTVQHFWPHSRVGAWSVLALIVAAVFPLGLSSVVPPTYAGAPLGAVAFVLAVVAITRYHDRSPLLLLPLIVGLLVALFPIAFVLLQPGG